MSAKSRTPPDFAGISLVDILANGVAVLIIVIVITIAVRSETEQVLGEQAQEVASVMTREFSTSLVLNRLAASPPAVLHDYERSPIDLVWDPRVLPVFEFHADLVRDPYSGETWSRAELLRDPNGLDDFLRDFDNARKALVRIDMYDVGIFYLAMSVLRDHGISPRHWHFIGASVGTAAAASCPPGMPAKDCRGDSRGGSGPNFALEEESADENNGEGADARMEQEGWEWGVGASLSGSSPGSEGDDLPGEGKGLGGQMPGGIALGNASPESTERSFPDADAQQGSNGSGGAGSASASLLTAGGSATLRLAIPGSQTNGSDSGLQLEDSQGLDDLLAALLLYLRDLQGRIDRGEPPTMDLLDFKDGLSRRFDRVDELTDQDRDVVDYLVTTYELRARQGGITQGSEDLALGTAPAQDLPERFLKVFPNRPLLDAEIGPRHNDILESFPEAARIRLNLNAFPGVWQGLRIDADEGSVLLMPSEQLNPGTPGWRAAAYLSPVLDDLVLGFVYGTLDSENRLQVLADTNNVQIGYSQLATPFDSGWFHVKSWLVVLYAALALCLLGLLLLWKPKRLSHP